MGKSTGKGGAESAVEERRLRPIYELLDINLNKKAVQELDRLLKKQPNFTSAKVLKALALLRLGKKTECEDIIATVVSDDIPAPTDDNTIQALSICFRELGKPKSICDLLDRACKVDKSEDLLTHNFMAHVRVGEFQKQHQIALSLCKLYPKTPYFYWSVMSLYVKAEVEANEPSSLKLTLPLAERMMEKYMEDNKIDTDQELHLYLLILWRQGKYAKILELLDSASIEQIKLGSVVGFFQKIKIDCLKKLERDEALAQYLENSMVETSVEWKYFEEYVHLSFNSTNSESVGLSRAKAFFQNLLDNYNSTTEIEKKKNVFLASFLCFKLMAERNISLEWDVLPIFKSYCQDFGQKPTFFKDISEFAEALKDKTSISVLLETLKSSAPGPDSPLRPIDQIQRDLNYVFIQQFFGEGETEAKAKGDGNYAIDQFETLVLKYLHNNLCFDDYLVVAIIQMTDRFWSGITCDSYPGILRSTEGKEAELTDGITGDGPKSQEETTVPPPTPDSSVSEITNGLESATLEDTTDPDTTDAVKATKNEISASDFAVLYSASVLNYGLYENMNNAQFRVLLAKLFIRCGAVGAASDTLRGLDVKHMQLESLGYVYIAKVTQSGFFNEGYRLLHYLEHFHSTHKKDCMEHVLSAYKYGSWQQILDFMDFQKMLSKSAQFAAARVERRLLEFMKDTVSRDHTVKIAQRIHSELDIQTSILNVVDELTDCRDLEVLAETGLRKPENFDYWKETTFQEEKKRIKLRGLTLLLMNSVALLMDPATTTTATTTTGQGSAELMKRIEAAESRLGEELNSTQIPNTPDINSITGPWTCRVEEYIGIGYCQLFVKLSSVIRGLCPPPQNPTAALVKSFQEIKEDLIGLLNEHLLTWRTFQKRKHLVEFPDSLERGVDFLQTLSFTCVFLDAIAFLLEKNLISPNQKVKKRKGKGSSSSMPNATSEELSQISAGFLDLVDITGGFLKEVQNGLECCVNTLIQSCSTSWENIDGLWKRFVNEEIRSKIIAYSMPSIGYRMSESYCNSLQEISMIVMLKLKYLDTIRAQFQL